MTVELAPILPRHLRPLVMTRAQWGAARPRSRYSARGRLRAVVLHHTSRETEHLLDRDAEAAYMREIQQMHLARGWTDVGYHFVIMPTGRICLGRPVYALGAHVIGHNLGTVGISLAGDFDVEAPTPEAIRSIDQVLEHLIPEAARAVPLVAHRDLVPVTTCPGDLLHLYVQWRRRSVPPEPAPLREAYAGMVD
jgi:N-acetylmuramoyl-L-alanine amidase